MKYSLAIHGGAGTIVKSNLTAELEQAYTTALKEALIAGELVLKSGGSALDAVEKAVISLEDCPLFNAGKGAVFTADKSHQMDASIMCGKTLQAGAIAGVERVKNPIVLAKEIIDHSDHVFLYGKGAEQFAELRNIKMVDSNYFYTEHRYQQLLQAINEDKIVLDHSGIPDKKFGTVGAVALDQFGNLAAATSTGGMTNKKFNRIGDSPIIGAGTYANNLTCAISCTGHGEYFIRSVVAYDISCLMEYKSLSLEEACKLVVNDKLVKIGGEGGLVAVDAKGTIAMPFNSQGMYRAAVSNDVHPIVGIYEAIEL